MRTEGESGGSRERWKTVRDGETVRLGMVRQRRRDGETGDGETEMEAVRQKKEKTVETEEGETVRQDGEAVRQEDRELVSCGKPRARARWLPRWVSGRGCSL